MGAVRISEAEATRDFAAVLARVRAGEEVVIENTPCAPVVLRVMPGSPTRRLSDSLRIARERGSKVTLDSDFGRDLQEAIDSHQEPIDVSWE